MPIEKHVSTDYGTCVILIRVRWQQSGDKHILLRLFRSYRRVNAHMEKRKLMWPACLNTVWGSTWRKPTWTIGLNPEPSCCEAGTKHQATPWSPAADRGPLGSLDIISLTFFKNCQSFLDWSSLGKSSVKSQSGKWLIRIGNLLKGDVGVKSCMLLGLRAEAQWLGGI